MHELKELYLIDSSRLLMGPQLSLKTDSICHVVNFFDLIWAMTVYPPTATFKGEHDGVGNLDKKVIRQAELAEIGRYPTTRSYMPLLWSQPDKTPRELSDPARKTHEIDQRCSR